MGELASEWPPWSNNLYRQMPHPICMNKKTITIAQPTFLPWMGWFDLADQVDTLILLDDVAFSKQSWQQRNRIRTRNGLEFLIVPVKTSGRLGQKISDCELAGQSFAVKLGKTLQANYSKAPFFDSNILEFTSIVEIAVQTNRLVDLNCALISWMALKLGVKTPMIRASTLEVGGERGEHVARICEAAKAGRYLSPAGAEEYLIEDRHAFEARGIEVLIHVYEHPEYAQQLNPFIPYASALDLIFNLGPGAGDAMRSGRRPAREIGGVEVSPSKGGPNEN